jgi:RNA polymerase sigma-70 factor, ECF subfamily
MSSSSATPTSNAPRDEVRTWFEGVLRANYRLVYVTAYRIVRNAEDAEDAAQAAALKAFKSLHALAHREAVVSWLVQITRTVALDLYRSRAASPARAGGGGGDEESLLEHAAPDAGSPDPGAFNDDLRSVLLREFNKLSEGQADVLTLRHLEGLDVAQISQRLGIHEVTARARLFRAYENLRTNPRIRKVLGLE